MTNEPNQPTGTTRRSPRPATGVRPLRMLQAIIIGAVAMLTIAGAPLGASTGSRSVTLNEASNHRTVAVDRGTRVTVTLHSTYWSLTPVRSPLILAPVGAITVTGAGPGTAGCVPGQGCGTVIAHFVARHAGFVRLHASRTSCGEALSCTPAQSAWTVVVHVR